MTNANDQITVTSMGRSSLFLQSDLGNTAGEPGGAYVSSPKMAGYRALKSA